MIVYLKKLSIKNEMGEESFTERMGIARHEAAHSVIGYIHGHSTNYIDINLNEGAKIYPHVDKCFGNDQDIIEEIKQQNVQALQEREFTDVTSAAERYCIGLLAGTFAEFWYLYKRYPTLLREINYSDRQGIIRCINSIYTVAAGRINKSRFLHNCMTHTINLIEDPLNSLNIKIIANTVITSTSFRIERLEIERKLNRWQLEKLIRIKTGLTRFIR